MMELLREERRLAAGEPVQSILHLVVSGMAEQSSLYIYIYIPPQRPLLPHHPHDRLDLAPRPYIHA